MRWIQQKYFAHKLVQKAIQINFQLAVLVSILGGVGVLLKPELIFSEVLQLYGPLTRNLLLVIGYLVVMQVLLFIFRQGGYFEALVIGVVFLLTALGIPFYSYVNGIPLNLPLLTALAYCGLSHLAYFAWSYGRLRDQGGDRQNF
jgi:hypothetical protein